MLQAIAERTFILAEADWTAGETLRLLEPLGERACLVVVDDGPPVAYYVFTRDQASDQLKLAPAKRPLRKALKLSELKPAPVVGAHHPEKDAPLPAVVVDPVDRDRVVGVLPPSASFKGGPGPAPVPPAPVRPLPPGPVPPRPKMKWLDDLTGWVLKRPDGAPIPPWMPLSPMLSTAESASASESAELTRAVKTRFPAQVQRETIAVLRLWFAAEAGVGDPTIQVAVGSEVVATVKPRLGFEVVGADRGGDRGAITVTEAPETAALEFRLKATETGPGVIRVYLESGGASLGYFDLVAEVVEGAVAMAAEVDGAAALPGVEGADLLPDLIVRIVEQRIEGKPHYRFVLSYAGADGAPVEVSFGPQPIELDSLAYFRRFFENVENTLLSEAEAELEWSGKELFETLFPEPLQKVIWEHRARIGISVQVVSEEPWVPWELCYLTGVEDGAIKEGPFLCEAFAVTRWIRDAVAKPTLHLDQIALVTPTSSNLASAPDEKAYLLSLAGPGRVVNEVAPTRKDVLAAMGQGQARYGAWHFICHGYINPDEPNKSALDLDGSALQPRHIFGLAANMGQAQPLVFLNACQTGAGGLALTGAGGWANVFLKAAQEVDPRNGAAAFIGSYWKVDDKAALTFTRAFYDALLVDKDTVGEAARKARLKTKADHPSDPSWLAYTVYAHPLAKAAV
jgi:hypothetical protein